MRANLTPHHWNSNAGPRSDQSGVIGVLHEGNLGVRIGKRIAGETCFTRVFRFEIFSYERRLVYAFCWINGVLVKVDVGRLAIQAFAQDWLAVGAFDDRCSVNSAAGGDPQFILARRIGIGFFQSAGVKPLLQSFGIKPSGRNRVFKLRDGNMLERFVG